MSTHALAVLEIVRNQGLACHDLVPLRSTNNTVFLLDQLSVVAKVHESATAAAQELGAGRALAAAGAPVVPPASGIGEQVHRAEGVHVTFWEYVVDATSDSLSSTAVAVSLRELHSHLADLHESVAGRPFVEQLVDAMGALRDEAFAPLLGDADRRLLLRVLGDAEVQSRGWPPGAGEDCTEGRT